MIAAKDIAIKIRDNDAEEIWRAFTERLSKVMG